MKFIISLKAIKMRPFNKYRKIVIPGEFLTKDEIQSSFHLTDKDFLKAYHNNELLNIQVNDQPIFPTFQFENDLNDICFGKIVRQLYERMYVDTVIDFLFTENNWLECETGFLLPIDAIKNGYLEEVLVFAECDDFVQFSDMFEDPEQALIELLIHS